MKANLLKSFSYALSATAVFAVTALAATSAQAQQVPGRVATPIATTQNTESVQLLTNTGDRTIRVPLNAALTVQVSGKVRNVIIADPAVADIILPEGDGRTSLYVVGRAAGSTSVIFEDAGGNILFEGTVQVDVDVNGISDALKQMMPDDHIEVTSHRDGVFLTGYVRTPGDADRAVVIARRYVPDPLNIINSLEVLGSKQVILQVRIAEVRRSALKELGVNFQYLGGNGISFATSSTPVNTSFATGSAGVGNTLGIGPVTVNMMESQGVLKTLAEPTLTAMSGETAGFLAGGSFQTLGGTDSNGNNTYTTVDYGVSLNFTPLVVDKGSIQLTMDTEVSSPDATTGSPGTVGTKTTRANTVVNLPSGGSIMIAGLLQDDIADAVNGLPMLKDLPILGALFRSQNFINNETELVITVTAYLAESVDNSARLALPTDGFAASSDMDMLLLGELYKRHTGKELPPYATPLAGPYGYIME